MHGIGGKGPLDESGLRVVILTHQTLQSLVEIEY